MLKFILLLVIFLDLFLGFFVISENRKSWNNRLFSLLSFFSAIWTFTNYMTGVYPTAFWLESTYAIGSLVLGAGLVWVFFLVDKILDKKKIFIVSLGALSLFISSYLEGFIAKKYEKIYLGGAFVGESGFGLIIYTLVFLTAVVFILYKLFFAWQEEINKEIKTGLLYVFYGALATLTISFLTSFVFPLFHVFTLSGLDSIGFLIFLSFIAYATTKHHLFNIKVIATELLTFAIWVFLLVQVILADSLRGRFISGALLFLVIIFGIFLIRSVIKEVEQRNRLEDLTKELQTANEKLKELDRLKSEFISIVSHQVRTPMTVIKGFASLIESDAGKLSIEKVQDMARKIKLATDRTVVLATNLLDMRRIEEGRMEYTFEEMKFSEFVENVVAELQLIAQGKKLEFTYEGPGREVIVHADPSKLRQVIYNLVENALKYTYEGWVKVRVTVDGDSVLFGVTDSGRGISPEALPNLFKEFSRDAASKSIQGTGLGLFIAKQIVLAHTGEVWAESEGIGKGAGFFVRLPLPRNQ